MTSLELAVQVVEILRSRNRTCSEGQSIAGHESDVVGSNPYVIM